MAVKRTEMQLIIDGSAIAEIYSLPASSSPAWCGKELGHAILHEEGNDLEREHKEIEAESVAYVVSQALGIDSGDYSFGYLTSWGHGDPEAVEKQLKSSGQRIQKAAHQIIQEFGKVPTHV